MGGAIISESGGGIIPLRGATSSRNWGAASSGISTLQDISLRSADVFPGVIRDFPNESDTVVLVGHDSVNRALLLQLLDQPLSAYWKIAQDACCINVIEYQDGAIRALSINATQHIKSPNINLKPNHPKVILRMGPQVRA
jgi:broad specificity phosphatase PhoE